MDTLAQHRALDLAVGAAQPVGIYQLEGGRIARAAWAHPVREPATDCEMLAGQEPCRGTACAAGRRTAVDGRHRSSSRYRRRRNATSPRPVVAHSSEVLNSMPSARQFGRADRRQFVPMTESTCVCIAPAAKPLLRVMSWMRATSGSRSPHISDAGDDSDGCQPPSSWLTGSAPRKVLVKARKFSRRMPVRTSRRVENRRAARSCRPQIRNVKGRFVDWPSWRCSQVM